MSSLRTSFFMYSSFDWRLHFTVCFLQSSWKCQFVETFSKCESFYSNKSHISEVLPTSSSSRRPPSDTTWTAQKNHVIVENGGWNSRSGDVSLRLHTNPRICCVYQAWIPQSHMVYVHRTQVPHATPNYRHNDLTLLPHLHVTHWHQMWSTACIHQPVEIQTITFLKMPG